MWENNIRDDDADSVLVPFGYKVTLFDQDGFLGDTEEIKGKPYEDANDEMICQNLGDLKNRAASIRVGRTTVLGPAIGYWEGVTHSEDITVTYHIGFDYSKSVEEQSTQQYTMSYEMSFGYEFEGASESETISKSYSSALMHDVQTTYDADFSIEHTLKCTAPEEGGVGFW